MDTFDRLQAAIDTIAPRFMSGNDNPVQKATVPLDEWAAVLEAMNGMRNAWSWVRNPDRSGC